MDEIKVWDSATQSGQIEGERTMIAGENFRLAVSKTGLDYAGPLVPDGKLHRIRASGDREHNSWYVLHSGPPLAGAFGCWKRGVNETWCECEPRSMTETQWAAVRKKWQAADAEQKRAERERRKCAQDVARRLYDRASLTCSEHPYLKSKNVGVHGDLRLTRDGKLLLPLRDAEGDLHSLQLIAADGTKRYLSGGRVSGCFYFASDRADGPLVICEGYATAASINEATGFAVVCALSAGNLLPVAKALREKWPDREIVLAADNDQWTENNPGLSKATEAAKASHGKLAVPDFTGLDQTSRSSDFNDLARLAGADEVRAQFTKSEETRETEEETIARLAALPLIAYERVREAEADRMGIRVSILDSEVERLRKSCGNDSTLQGRTVDLPEIEPWPEPVNGAEILCEIAAAHLRYSVLPSGASDALALWEAHSHSFEVFEHSPRLAITSPEKGCGKTTLRDVVALFVPRPLSSENLTSAVLFRIAESYKPVILADEFDTWISDNEELRGILNAGHKRGGQVFRCEGDNHEVRGFNVFCPVVLCGIGSLPATLHDRSILIRLERAKPGEVQARFDSRRTEAEEILRRKLARWCADHREQIAKCDPVLPPDAHNRVADNWRPLFAIAEIAGGIWPARARSAFASLTMTGEADNQGLSTMLLGDIREVFSETQASRIFSRTLVEQLNTKTERPWPEANRGKPISETWLARRLKGFGISPSTLRIGEDRLKGYTLEDFREAFERYLSLPGETKRDLVTTPESIGDSEIFEACRTNDPSRIKDSIPTSNNGHCHAVTVQDADNPGEEADLF